MRGNSRCGCDKVGHSVKVSQGFQTFRKIANGKFFSACFGSASPIEQQGQGRRIHRLDAGTIEREIGLGDVATPWFQQFFGFINHNCAGKAQLIVF